MGPTKATLKLKWKKSDDVNLGQLVTQPEPAGDRGEVTRDAEYDWQWLNVTMSDTKCHGLNPL